jgi:hypothetical protein
VKAARTALAPAALVMLTLVTGMLAPGCVGGLLDQRPPAPYFDACSSDADCAPSFQCLSWTGLGPVRTVCTAPCVTQDDCPRVVTEHCGDITRCVGGVCGFAGCR